MTSERREAPKWTKEGVIFLVEQDGMLLLEERPESDSAYGGYTIIPGGKFEAGENALGALFREMYEELGIKGNSYVFEPLEAVFYFTPKGEMSRTHSFLVRLLSGEGVTNMEPHKGKHVWLSPEEALNRCELAVSKYVITLAQKKLNEAKLNKG